MQYSYKITLKKVAVVFVEVLIAGAVVYVTEQPEYIFLVPVLEGIRNFLKHKVGLRLP